MPRIFGTEIKGRTLWIVIGVIAAGVAVVVYVRSRAPALGTGAPGMVGTEFAGGGGGISVSAPSDGAAAEYQSRLQGIQLEAAEFGLERQREEAVQQAKQFDLAFLVNDAYSRMQAALFGQQTQIGEAYAQTEVATQRVIQRTVGGKKKVQCPAGEHFVVLADGSTACQPLGGGGFNFKTITSGLGNTLENAWSAITGFTGGVASAAPGIGYGAAQAYAGRQGVFRGSSRPPASTSPYFTPPIAPVGVGRV